MSRITLMGHSRGGEAVAVAAAFNTLSYYPDDATIKFDFAGSFGDQAAARRAVWVYSLGTALLILLALVTLLTDDFTSHLLHAVIA